MGGEAPLGITVLAELLTGSKKSRLRDLSLRVDVVKTPAISRAGQASWASKSDGVRGP